MRLMVARGEDTALVCTANALNAAAYQCVRITQRYTYKLGGELKLHIVLYAYNKNIIYLQDFHRMVALLYSLTDLTEDNLLIIAISFTSYILTPYLSLLSSYSGAASIYVQKDNTIFEVEFPRPFNRNPLLKC